MTTIYIFNNVTPNGDGINDICMIEGIDNDPGSIVKVFKRNSALIFESVSHGPAFAINLYKKWCVFR
jgi:gliding motility-associated-like protein